MGFASTQPYCESVEQDELGVSTESSLSLSSIRPSSSLKQKLLNFLFSSIATVPAPKDWWEPLRQALMYSLHIPDKPLSDKRSFSLPSSLFSHRVRSTTHLFFSPSLAACPSMLSAVITYINRQSTSRRKLKDEDHLALMQALYEVEAEGYAREFSFALSSPTNPSSCRELDDGS